MSRALRDSKEKRNPRLDFDVGIPAPSSRLPRLGRLPPLLDRLEKQRDDLQALLRDLANGDLARGEGAFEEGDCFADEPVILVLGDVLGPFAPEFEEEDDDGALDLRDEGVSYVEMVR